MPEEKKELPIPITGIQLMEELSLDAHMMIYLASEGILMPFRPIIHESYMKLLMGCNYDTAIDKVTDWRYRKADIEHFKLNYKDYFEELRLSHGLNPTAPEPQSDTAPIPAAPVPVVAKSVDNHIKQRKAEGAKIEEIVVELYDKKGIFKLTYLEISRKLDLGKDLQPDQIDTMKKRAERACIRGKDMLAKSGKRKKS
jgi:hypothetical protein